jgi:hypothetical protein
MQVCAGYYIQTNTLKTMWSSETERCVVWYVVDVLNKQAASIFSVEIFYSENGGAEQSNIDPNCCENLKFIQRT